MLRRLARTRWFLVTVVPVVACVGLLGLGELVCAVFGVAPAPRYFRQEMRDGASVLVRHENTPREAASFHPESLPVAKPEGTRRILCLGGSTTHGHPFDPPGAFPDWLGVRLPRLLPEQDFEVWNLGANGLDMTAIRMVMDELWVLQPDLLVLYTGHNEFLDQNLGPLLHAGGAGTRHLLGRYRLGRLALDSVRTDRASRARTAHGDVFDEPFLSQDVRDRGVQRFQQQLDGFLAEAAAHQVPVLLCKPVSDLLDTPVRASSFSPDTSPAERQEWRRLAEELQSLPPDAPGRDRLRERLTALDDHPALLRYWDGWRQLVQLNKPEAERLLSLARDQDEYPIRATSRILQIIEDEGAAHQAMVVDSLRHLETEAWHGIPGQSDLFVDYCHPNLEGHRQIADGILRALMRADWCTPGDAWQRAEEPALEEYRVLMGQSPEEQATGLARRALAVLANDPLGAGDEAARFVELALQVDADCALAWATRGFLHCREGQGDEALAAFERAWRRDPQCLAPFAEQAASHPQLAPIFRRAGVGFEGLRPIRVDSP